MADNAKRYYWLKLKDDFFSDKKIKKLRLIAGGDTYTIIYLKMQLLSLKNNGVLIYEGIEPTFAEELALDLDEEVENVKITLSYLYSSGMIEETEPSRFLMTETIKCIGSESASAERVRKHREIKAKNQELLQCNTDVTKCNIEKDIDIEKEIEINNNACACAHEEESNEDLYNKLLKIVQEHCPILYERHLKWIDSGNIYKAGELIDLVDFVYKRYTEKELIELIKKADKTYIVLPKYANCDLVWVLNNLERVKGMEVINESKPTVSQQPPITPKTVKPKVEHYASERDYSKEDLEGLVLNLSELDDIDF